MGAELSKIYAFFSAIRQNGQYGSLSHAHFLLFMELLQAGAIEATDENEVLCVCETLWLQNIDHRIAFKGTFNKF